MPKGYSMSMKHPLEQALYDTVGALKTMSTPEGRSRFSFADQARLKSTYDNTM